MPSMEEIDARLERIEEMLLPLSRSARSMNELKRELEPRVNEAVKAITIELAQLEPYFQSEDLVVLLKQMAVSSRQLTYAMQMLNKGLDFIDVSEPLLRDSMGQFIESLDRLERNGVFALGRSLLKAAEAFATDHSQEEIDRLQNALTGLMQAGAKLSDERSLRNLDKLAGVPGLLDLDDVPKLGLFGLLGAMKDEKVKRGLGALIKLTRALGEAMEDGRAEAPAS